MNEKKCVLYGRVSTSSDEQKLSLDEQVRTDDSSMFSNYLKNSGYEIAEIFSDVQSGTSYERKGFQELLRWFGIEKIEITPTDKKSFSDGKKHYYYDVNKTVLNDRKNRLNCNRIICKNTSRWTRTGDITISNLLKENGIYIYFLEESIDTQNDDIELVYKIITHMDKSKSQDTSRKVKTGLEQSIKNKHIRTNSRITGYDLIPRTATTPTQLVQNDDSKYIKYIFDLYTNNLMGARLIHQELLEKYNKDISVSTIKRILKNEKYAGYINIEKKWDTGEVFNHHSPKNLYGYKIEICPEIKAPIIDIDTFLLAQKIMEKRSDDNSVRGRKTSISPYFHKVVCEKCKNYYVNSQAYYKKNEPYTKIMLCGNKRRNTIKACDNPNVKIEDLDQALEEIINNSKNFWKEEKKNLINDYLILLLLYGSYVYLEPHDINEINNKLTSITQEINELIANSKAYPDMKPFFDKQIKELYNEYNVLQSSSDYYTSQVEECKLNFNLIVEEITNIENFSSKTSFTKEEFLEQDILFYVKSDKTIEVKTGRKTLNKHKEFIKYSGLKFEHNPTIIENITDISISPEELPASTINEFLTEIFEKANLKKEWKYMI